MQTPSDCGRSNSPVAYQNGQWIVLDYVDVVCQLFLKEKREFYQLERLWGDAPRLAVES